MACFYSKITGGDRIEEINEGKGHEKWESQRKKNGIQEWGSK